ncbi:hypothetical protein M0813_01821 [Anaeramoeba flamelloides]|uniref:Uncharacterized protein n=1 Tax=Anaeramoeba flamelloides TaxID=1746091 RepID=A0ABQ8YXD7_9EUKA|nr:hypothetical protein M0813_01821 [Anaeramoeba flamelloides]
MKKNNTNQASLDENLNLFLNEEYKNRKYQFFSSQASKIGYKSYGDKSELENGINAIDTLFREIKWKLEETIGQDFLNGLGLVLEYLQSGQLANLGTKEQTNYFNIHFPLFLAQTITLRANDRKYQNFVLQIYEYILQYSSRLILSDQTCDYSKAIGLILHVSAYEKWDKIRESFELDEEYKTERQRFKTNDYCTNRYNIYDSYFYSKIMIKRLNTGPLSTKYKTQLWNTHLQNKAEVLITNTKKIKEIKFSVLHEQDKITSLYLLQNIEFFGEIGGFESLLVSLDKIKKELIKLEKIDSRFTKEKKSSKNDDDDDDKKAGNNIKKKPKTIQKSINSQIKTKKNSLSNLNRVSAIFDIIFNVIIIFFFFFLYYF